MGTFLENIRQTGRKIGSTLKRIGLVIVDKLRKHPILCNIVISVLMTIILETLEDRERIFPVFSSLRMRGQRCSYIAY